MKFQLIANIKSGRFTDYLYLTVEKDQPPEYLGDFAGSTGSISDNYAGEDDNFTAYGTENPNVLKFTANGHEYWLRTDLNADLPRTGYSKNPIQLVPGGPIYRQPVVPFTTKNTSPFGKFQIKEIKPLAEKAT